MFESYNQGNSLVQLTHVFAQPRCKASAISLRTATPMSSSQKFLFFNESDRKAMNRNWRNQKVNPALKTKTENK